MKICVLILIQTCVKVQYTVVYTWTVKKQPCLILSYSAFPHVQFMWAFGPRLCGLDVIITFLNYDIKNLIVM